MLSELFLESVQRCLFIRMCVSEYKKKMYSESLFMINLHWLLCLYLIICVCVCRPVTSLCSVTELWGDGVPTSVSDYSVPILCRCFYVIIYSQPHRCQTFFPRYSQYWLYLAIASDCWVISIVTPWFPPNWYLSLIAS